MRKIFTILAASMLVALAAGAGVEVLPAGQLVQVAQASSTGAWRVDTTQRNLLDGSASAIAIVDSETSIPNVIGFKERASLILRCRSGVFEAYVTWPNFLGSDSVSARYRIGASSIASATWNVSTTGTAAFIINPSQFVNRLSGQKELVVALRAWATTEQSVLFPIDGIDSVLSDLRRSCPNVFR